MRIIVTRYFDGWSIEFERRPKDIPYDRGYDVGWWLRTRKRRLFDWIEGVRVGWSESGDGPL